MSDIVIFEQDNHQVEVRLEADTVWLSLQQLADVFGRDKSVISRHLKNIFASGELQREAVVAKSATTARDGKTYQVEHYNLDAIISVGYRVNSRRATAFRQWATRVLRETLTRQAIIQYILKYLSGSIVCGAPANRPCYNQTEFSPEGVWSWHMKKSSA